MSGYGEGAQWALAAPTPWPLLATGVVSAVLAGRRMGIGHMERRR
jgi:hypothetical protein